MNARTEDGPSPAARPLARLAVLLSGSGRTLVNLAERIQDGRLNARLSLVIASRECPGAERARSLGLPTVVEPGVIPADRLRALLDEAGADWVVLAGYLKLVQIPPKYAGRIVNIHPALLPRHGGPGMYGHRVHEAVIAAGDAESGCTVHLCDPAFDTGPILLQRRCVVEREDDPDRLAARVFALECETYPEALAGLIAGRYDHLVRQIASRSRI